MKQILLSLLVVTTTLFAHEGAAPGHSHEVTGTPSLLWLQEALAIDGATYQKLTAEIDSFMVIKAACPVMQIKKQIIAEVATETPDMKKIKKLQKQLGKQVTMSNPTMVEHLLAVKAIIGNEAFTKYTKCMKRVYNPATKETDHLHQHTHDNGVTHGHPHQHMGDTNTHEHSHESVDHGHEHQHDNGEVHSHDHNHDANIEDHHHTHDAN